MSVISYLKTFTPLWKSLLRKNTSPFVLNSPQSFVSAAFWRKQESPPAWTQEVPPAMQEVLPMLFYLCWPPPQLDLTHPSPRGWPKAELTHPSPPLTHPSPRWPTPPPLTHPSPPAAGPDPPLDPPLPPLTHPSPPAAGPDPMADPLLPPADPPLPPCWPTPPPLAAGLTHSPPLKNYTPPPLAASWTPPCGQTESWMDGQTRVKTLPSPILRMRAVIKHHNNKIGSRLNSLH